MAGAFLLLAKALQGQLQTFSAYAILVIAASFLVADYGVLAAPLAWAQNPQRTHAATRFHHALGTTPAQHLEPEAPLIGSLVSAASWPFCRA